MEERSDEDKKKIDESWKEAVEKKRASAGEDVHDPIEATFNLFVTSLMMQALIALGEIDNPVTKKKEPNPEQARFLIDTLAMLRDKTLNNLTKDETDMLDSVLYELRMRFVGRTANTKPKEDR